MGGCYFRNIIPFFVPKCYEGKFTFVVGRESSEDKRKIESMHIESGLYPSIVDIVVAMKNKIRERLEAKVFKYNGVYKSVDKITQKISVHSPEDQSVFIIQSSDLSPIWGCDLEQNQTGYIERKRSTLSSVFLRHYKNAFFDDK